VEAGHAILVNPHFRCASWQALMRRRAGELPPRGCLECSPGWAEVHRMAMQDYRWQFEKEDAVRSMQFDRAAELKDAQYRERELLVVAVGRILDEAD
jgi:hypothetical protein